MFSKKQKKLTAGLIILLVSFFAIIFSDTSSELSKPFQKPDASPIPSRIIEDEEIQGVSISIIPPQEVEFEESVEEGEEIVSLDLGKEKQGFKVVKVVDGDTLDVDINGKIERLRLVGIDSPETVDPRKSVQCFGIEASSKAKELLNGKFVTLESDESQGDRDKYKRLLRYVFLPDGSNFNLFMIAEGYAYEYTYDEPYKYQADFKQAQINARNSNKGLWSPSTCSGIK